MSKYREAIEKLDLEVWRDAHAKLNLPKVTTTPIDHLWEMWDRLDSVKDEMKATIAALGEDCEGKIKTSFQHVEYAMYDIEHAIEAMEKTK